MASVVQIELQVNDSGAVTGFRSLNAAGAQVETTIKAVAVSGTQMGAAVSAGANQATAAVKNLAAAETQVAGAAKAAGAAAAEAADNISTHMLGARESVALFGEEMGVHIPRAMKGVIAQSQLVMSALNAMQTAMIAIGGIGIAAELGKQIYEVGKELFTTDDAVRKLNDDLAETARKKLMDMASIEEVRAGIGSINDEIDSLTKKLESGPNSLFKAMGQHQGDFSTIGWSAVMPLAGLVSMYEKGKGDMDQRKQDAESLKLLKEIQGNSQQKINEDSHEENLANFKVDTAKAQQIRDEKKRNEQIAAIEKKQNEENARYQRASQQNLYNTINTAHKAHGEALETVPEGAFETQAARANKIVDADLVEKNAKVDQQAHDKGIAAARQQSDEIIRLRDEATNAGLKGEQLLEAQREQAIAQYEHKYGASRAAIDAINARYHAEEMNRIDEQNRSLAKRERDAAVAGMQGVAAMEQRGRNRQADINDDLASGKYFGTDEEQKTAAQRDRVAAQRTTDAEIEAEQKRFSEAVNEIAASSADRQVQGFARIRAEGDKQLAALQKRFEEVYGAKNDGSPEYAKGLSELDRGKSAISLGVGRQSADLARKNAGETAKIEEDAYRLSLPQAAQREQAIRDQYNDRLRAYQEMLSQQEISQDDFNRRALAATEEMNAELATEARQRRDQLAGEIQPFFSHPLQALEHIGEQQASRYMATLLMKKSGTAVDTASGKRGNLFDFPFSLHPHKTASSTHPVDTVVAQSSTADHHAVIDATKGTRAATSASALRQMTVNATTVILNARGIAANGKSGNVASGSTGLDSAISQSGISLGSGSDVDGGSSADSSSGVVASASTDLGPAISQSSSAIGSAPSADSTSIATASKDASNVASITNNAADLGKEAGSALKSTSLSGASEALGKVGATAGAAAGLFAAAEGNGGAGGALSGAMAGMQLGSMIPIPGAALVGAAAGAILGFMGFGGASKAKKYYEQQVKPRISNDITSFGMGSMDYQSVYTDLVQLDADAKKQTKQWGMGGQREYNDAIHPDIERAQQTVLREQKAGRSQYGMNAAEHHGGGQILGFGDFSTSPNEGWIHAKRGETVMHTSSTAMHGDALGLMLAGATRNQMAGYYGADTQQMATAYRRTMQTAAFGGPGHTYNTGDTYHVNAIDTKNFHDALIANRHSVRAATNQSYMENSGGSDLG